MFRRLLRRQPKPPPLPEVIVTQLPFADHVVLMFGRKWLERSAIRDYQPLYPDHEPSTRWEGDCLTLTWRA